MLAACIAKCNSNNRKIVQLVVVGDTTSKVSEITSTPKELVERFYNTFYKTKRNTGKSDEAS